jgi:hypothetical protein
MQTPFDKPVMPTPSASGDFQGTRGGMDLPDGQKETAGNGEIPALPTIDSFDGSSGPGEKSIEDFHASGRTWPANKGK